MGQYYFMPFYRWDNKAQRDQGTSPGLNSTTAYIQKYKHKTPFLSSTVLFSDSNFHNKLFVTDILLNPRLANPKLQCKPAVLLY